jgi:hypothetical protein
MKIFNWTFKLSFNADILTCFFNLTTVLATFSKFGHFFPNFWSQIWTFFPNLLVTLSVVVIIRQYYS